MQYDLLVHCQNGLIDGTMYLQYHSHTGFPGLFSLLLLLSSAVKLPYFYLPDISRIG